MQHNLFCWRKYRGENKIQIGAAIEDLKLLQKTCQYKEEIYLQVNQNKLKSLREIAKALDKSIQRIEDAVMETLSQTPPELAADIYNTGIFLQVEGRC
jgi:rod shape-determining protein MreB